MDFTVISFVRKGKRWFVCAFQDGDVVAIRMVKRGAKNPSWKATSKQGNYNHELSAISWLGERIMENLPDNVKADVKITPHIIYDHE